MASKGKAVMSGGKDSSDNRKRGVKRKNRDVLQFFEDAADEFDGSDDGEFSDGFFDDSDFFGDFNEDPKVRKGPEKFDQAPFFPKEEELSGDELEKMLEERYRSGSGFVRYAEDDYETKRSVDRSFLIPSAVEPIVWKLKCKVGREKNVVFCLIQKYTDLKVLGTKLQIISAFAVEHIKGFVFVEAEKQSDVTEACYQLADVYYTLVSQVPSNDLGQLLNVRRKNNEVKEGTWARVKNGIYRGDLAQVVAVNSERKRATVKLIPRVDMQALMEKYGGGSKLKRQKNAVPIARLISSRDLEELRPLMQYRRDRDTGKVFEFLDGLMLKDGFLFKKVSVDSLAFWDVNPSEDELQKFTLPSHDESDNMEWLSQLYGEKKKKCDVKIGKGGGKGEGSSGSNEHSGFEVHDLVLFGKKDFGMVIGMEKDDKFKVIKDGFEGPVTLSFEEKELKCLPLDKKFTALDHRMKTISINDTVRIFDGPLKDKQGIVKQIYRAIIFLYDENDLEHAYFCCKSKMSERVKNSDSACHGKDEGGLSAFEDVPSSPKSPLSPKKPWQMRENSSDDRRDKGAIFSVGQSLRIRVGPLKGYLCRVVAVRYSEVTVKLDSQQKVLTVKSEHLAEVRGKSSAPTMSDESGLASSFKPFDLLGGDGSTNDWLQGSSGSADAGGWNVGSSNERSTWSAVSSWGSSVQDSTTATAVPESVDNESGKEDAWLTKVNTNQSTWNASAVGKSDNDGAWGKPSGAVASSSWGKAKDSVGDHAATWNAGGSSSCKEDALLAKVDINQSSWDANAVGKSGNDGAWGKPSGAVASSSWGKAKDSVGDHATTWNASGSSSGKEDVLLAKVDSNQNSWNANAVGKSHNDGTWGKPSGAVASNCWGKAKDSKEDHAITWNASGSSAGKEPSDIVVAEAWDRGTIVGKETSNWSNKTADKGNSGSQSSENRVADAGGWGNHVSSGDAGSSGWGKQKAAEVSANLEKTDAWNHSKPSSNPVEDSWGKATGGFKSSFPEKKGWGNSSESPACDNKGWGKGSGSWAKSQEGSFGDDSGSTFNKTGGNDSWGQSKSFENDRGFSDNRGSGGRRGRGRDQYGRGRSFDGGQFSSFNKDSLDNQSSGNQGWKRNEGGSSWVNSSAGDAFKSGGNGKSWNNDVGGDGNWGKSENSESDQGFASGRGSGGRGRGGLGRGRDNGGRGRGDGRSQNSSWRSEGQGGSSWGNSSGGNGGGSSWVGSEEDKSQARGWGNAESKSDMGSELSGNKSWGSAGGWNQQKQDSEASGKRSWDSGQGGSSWGKSQSGGASAGSWNQQKQDSEASGKKSWDSGQGGSSWGKSQSGGASAGGWNQQKQDSEASGKKSWDSGQGGSSWVKSQSGGASAGSWNQQKQDSEASGKKSWDSGQGGSSWGKSQSCGASPGSGSSWGKSQSGGGNPGGSSSWGKSQPNEGQKKAVEGGSSWGGGSSDQTSLNKTGGWGDKVPDNVDSKLFGNPSQNSGEEGRSSCGQPQSGGSSWGNAGPSGNSGGGGGWGN